MRCVSPVAGAVRGTTARLSLGRKRRGDMRRFLPFCDPCAVWILEAARLGSGSGASGDVDSAFFTAGGAGRQPREKILAFAAV